MSVITNEEIMSEVKSLGLEIACIKDKQTLTSIESAEAKVKADMVEAKSAKNQAVLFGNGKEGLITTISRLTDQMKTMNDYMNSRKKTEAAILIGVIVMLIESVIGMVH